MSDVTILTQNEAIGAATANGGGRAPIASFWVRIMTSCMNIKGTRCLGSDDLVYTKRL